MQNNLSKKVVEAIKEQDLCPKPRWHFLAKEYSLWMIGGVLIIVGSLAFSIVLFMLVNNDWEVHEAIHESFLRFVFISIPYFWLLLFIFFIVGAEYYFRHTKKGYKYTIVDLVVGVLIINVVGGSIFYHIGLARAVDNLLVESAPKYYERAVGNRHLRWVSPDDGRLAGRVERVDVETILLQDVHGKMWQVIVVDTKIATGTDIIADSLLRVVGKQEDEAIFRAYYVLPAGEGPGLYHFGESKRPPCHNCFKKYK